MLRLRRVPPEHFAREFDQLAVLFILNLFVWGVLDTLHAESGSRLMLDGLYGWGFYLLTALIACALVARAYSQDADTRNLLIPVLSVAPFLLIVFWLASDFSQVSERPMLAIVLATVYLIFLSVRALQAAYGHSRARAAALAAVFLIAAPWGLRALDLDTRLWLTDDIDQLQADDADAESLLYDQPARLVAAVESMKDRVAGKANAFYVGFAGDGEQGIFKREALYAQQRLAAHFGFADRSIELINDNDDRESYPLATVSGLRQTLKLVASRMEVDDDVLVLMLTSHGSEDGLAVVNGSLALSQLGPADLQDALDESGIKWRVIIISACYSGVFVDALKNDTTLVLTASDAKHSSFGCDDQRDLTYFGEALLHDSLPGSPSLEQAFAKASDIIQRRETAEHKTHSNPQISIGARIHNRLGGLWDAGHAQERGTIAATGEVHSSL